MNIQQIAEMAGVSKATVSRVVNGFPGIRPELKEKIEKIIAETGWSPSTGARTLGKKKQGHIAIIAEDVTNPFYHDIIAGIHQTCLEENYQFLMSNSYASANRRHKLIEYFLSGGADGLILIESDLLGTNILNHALRDDSRPLVILENQIEGLPSVSVDNHALGLTAAQTLLSFGHRRIAHITGNYNFLVARQRHEGFVQGLTDAGLTLDSRYLMYGDFNWKSGYDAMGRLMSLTSRPTAVYAANDEMAYAAWRSARDMGLRVPEDVSILGTDGLKTFHDMTPRLSTIKQPCLEMGTKAAQLLFSLLKGQTENKTTALVLPFELKDGDTCARLGE